MSGIMNLFLSWADMPLNHLIFIIVLLISILIINWRFE